MARLTEAERRAAALHRANRQFTALDTANRGRLDRRAMDRLAQSVWDSFHPRGEPLSDFHRVELRLRLKQRIGSNRDGQLTFPEFERWFTKICRKVSEFKQATAAPASPRIREFPPRLASPRCSLRSGDFPDRTWPVVPRHSVAQV